MYFVRLSPIFFLLWGFLLLGPQACSPAPTCIGDVGTTTINPNGSPCDKRCDCNNQQYVGFCNDNNICESTARKDCSEKEEKQACTLLPIDAQENCNAGQQICQPAELTTQKWGDCKPVARTKAEDTPALCFDGLDNDCDGKYDKFDKDCASFCQPDSTRPCYTGDPKTRNRGICKLGTQTCNKDGKGYSACQDEVLPQKEECNGKDDNCNGVVDENPAGCTCDKEGATSPCYGGPDGTLNQGICSSGLQTCTKTADGLIWSACVGDITPQVENCDGIDNDCNGKVDDNKTCNPCGLPGTTQSCFGGKLHQRNQGVCRDGLQVCGADGLWSRCSNQTLPDAKQRSTGALCTADNFDSQCEEYKCDGLDNDCDGIVDEVCPYRACDTDVDCQLIPKSKGTFVCRYNQCVPENGGCTNGQTSCGGVCVDTQTSTSHCGSCGNGCLSDQTCQSGKCTCKQGTTLCGSLCVDTQSNKAHCGSCQTACTTNEVCQSGKCIEDKCPNDPNKTEPGICGCGKEDTPAQTADDDNDGLANCVDAHPKTSCPCFVLSDVQQAHTQSTAACVLQSANFDGEYSGVLYSKGAEQYVVGLQSENNKYACGKGCVQNCNGQQMQEVVLTKDQFDACLEIVEAGIKTCKNTCVKGQSYCAASCVDVSSDSAHCGRCGLSCPANVTCQNGQCQCPAGSTFCNGQCVNTQLSQLHCGQCNNPCSQGDTCTAGICKTSSCPAGQALCGSACVDILNNTTHCGACNAKCDQGRSCQNGVCLCPSGQVFCNGSCVNIQTNDAHCGQCNTACSGGQACQGGRCQCIAGKTLCSGTCVDTFQNDSNCGQCGIACAAGQICSGGVCLCPSGNAYCGNACVDLQTSNSHCGGCGLACASGQSCAKGVCTCPTNQLKCSNTCVNPNTNNNHCGQCNQGCAKGQCQQNVCPTDQLCPSHNCAFTCDTNAPCPDGLTCGTSKTCNGWQKMFHPASSLNPLTVKDIAADTTGAIYLIGEYTNNAKFDTFTLKGRGKQDIFIAKLNPQGTTLWAQSIGGSNGDIASGIAVSPDGKTVYITGTFVAQSGQTNPFMFPTSSGGDVPRAVVGQTYMYLAKVDPSTGFVTQTLVVGALSPLYVSNLAVDAQSNVYVAGYNYDTGPFNPDPFGQTGLYAERGDAGLMFILVYNSSLRNIFADRISMKGFSSIPKLRLAIVPSNNPQQPLANIWLTGSFATGLTAKQTSSVTKTIYATGSDDLFVAKCNTNTHFIEYLIPISTSGQERAGTITLEQSKTGPTGALLVTGGVSGSSGIRLGNKSLAKISPTYGTFLARITPTGNVDWAQIVSDKSTTTSPTIGVGLNSDPDGRYFMYIHGTAPYGTTPKPSNYANIGFGFLGFTLNTATQKPIFETVSQSINGATNGTVTPIRMLRTAQSVILVGSVKGSFVLPYPNPSTKNQFSFASSLPSVEATYLMRIPLPSPPTP
ncbi:MAG: hypothetical protein CL920_33580 [Deltaproteobacteria bacterium]|nr:hypothetical protein [Deltaproteobacteria bacterium]MBU53656.1 hypothetical protein [Deltaproteobacteria bacterium]